MLRSNEYFSPRFSYACLSLLFLEDLVFSRNTIPFIYARFFDQKEALLYHEFYRIDAILDRKSRDRISNFEQERVNEHASNRKLHTGVELNHLAN